MGPLSIHPYAAAAAGVVILLLAIAVGVEHVRANLADGRADKAQLQRAAAIQQRDQVIDDNASQQATIAAQGAALNLWAELGVTPQDVLELAAGLRARSTELEQLVAANAKIKEKDNANPDCEKLRQVDFQRVCRNRARVLRGYEGRDPHRDRVGQGTGAGAAP
jgi:hypothetical protein